MNPRNECKHYGGPLFCENMVGFPNKGIKTFIGHAFIEKGSVKPCNLVLSSSTTIISNNVLVFYDMKPVEEG